MKKTILAGLLAVSTILGTAVTTEAQPVKVVVKSGYPYHHNGAAYRYSYGGRYYNARVKKCVIHGHRKVCTWKYR